MFARINSFIVSTWLAAREERGQATTEYALVLVLVVVAAAATMVVLKGDMTSWMTSVSSSITNKITAL